MLLLHILRTADNFWKPSTKTKNLHFLIINLHIFQCISKKNTYYVWMVLVWQDDAMHVFKLSFILIFLLRRAHSSFYSELNFVPAVDPHWRRIIIVNNIVTYAQNRQQKTAFFGKIIVSGCMGNFFFACCGLLPFRSGCACAVCKYAANLRFWRL